MVNPSDKIVQKLYGVLKEQLTGISGNEDLTLTSTNFENIANITTRSVGNSIIEVFPWPIGIELRRLFSGSIEQNKERVDQALKLAEKASQFLALILISQLWEEVKSNKITISPDFAGRFKSFFGTPAFGTWVSIVDSIHAIFEEHSITPFTEQFGNKQFSAKKLSGEMKTLVSMRNGEHHYTKKYYGDEVEEILTNMLCSLSFLVRFKLVTVSKIEVAKSRLKNVMYNHSLRMLTGIHDDFTNNREKYESYFETPAVMLFKDFKSPNQHLNLSPFIIDTSAIIKEQDIEGVLSGIYIYNTKTHNNYNYYFTNSDRQISSLNNLPGFDDLLNEFNDLNKTLASE